MEVAIVVVIDQHASRSRTPSQVGIPQMVRNFAPRAIIWTVETGPGLLVSGTVIIVDGLWLQP